MDDLFVPGAELSLESALSYAALGLIVGFGYYLGDRLPVAGESPLPKALLGAVTVLRLMAAIAFFAYLATLGATPILAAFVGFLVGRLIAFRLRGEDA